MANWSSAGQVTFTPQTVCSNFSQRGLERLEIDQKSPYVLVLSPQSSCLQKHWRRQSPLAGEKIINRQNTNTCQLTQSQIIIAKLLYASLFRLFMFDQSPA
jgi:cell division inhibitor SulA